MIAADIFKQLQAKCALFLDCTQGRKKIHFFSSHISLNGEMKMCEMLNEKYPPICNRFYKFSGYAIFFSVKDVIIICV